MTLYPPPQHARRENNFYRTPVDLAAGLLAGLRRAGLQLPTPIYDPIRRRRALLDGLELMGSGCDLFPGAYPSDSRLLLAPVDPRDRHALARVLGDARALVSKPPFGRDALPIAESPVELVHTGRVEMAALLLLAQWEAASGPRRVALMRAMDLRIVCCWRPVWVEGTAGGGKLNYAWHVWTREAPLFPLAIQVTREEAEAWRGRRRNPMIHHCTFEGCLKSVEWPSVFFLPPGGWTWLERWGPGVRDGMYCEPHAKALEALLLSGELHQAQRPPARRPRRARR